MNNVKKILQFLTQFPLTNNGNFYIRMLINFYKIFIDELKKYNYIFFRNKQQKRFTNG